MMETALQLFISINLFFWTIVAAVIVIGVMILTPIYIVIGICYVIKRTYVYARSSR
jgi:hypothetical protein